MGEGIFSFITLEFLNAIIRMASPIILAAIGEVVLERAGIINLGIEGMVVFGSFFGVLGSATFGNGWFGLLTSMVIGCLLGLFFGWIVITLRANQAVTGTAINILGLGLTAFLARSIWGIRPLPLQVDGIDAWPIPFLSKIPVIGQVLFNQSPIVYITYAVIFLASWILYKTHWGLIIRAVGENPKAVETIGINVNKWRYFCAIIAGMLAAMGGALLSLSQLNMFVENMSGGRGYFAIATVILGQWNPYLTALGGLIFGAGNALQMRLQAFDLGISSDLLLVLPFMMALLVVLVIRSETSAKPAALGQPYQKETTIK